MNRWSWTIALVLFCATSAQAETWDGRWGFGAHGGMWKQIGGSADYSNVAPAMGLHLRYGVTDALTVDLGMRYGWTRPGVDSIDQDAGFTFNSKGDLYTRIWQPNLAATWRFIPDGTWRPWVTAGAGVTRWDIRDVAGESAGLWPDGKGVLVLNESGETVDGHGVNFTGIIGIGTEIVASDHWSFDLGVRYHHLFGQNTDSVGLSRTFAPDGVDANTGLIEGLVGVTYAFGSSDRDGDGIPNKRDADPDQPEDVDGYQDADGAPDPDNDGDGVLDIDDGAPNDAEDIDGFQDEDGVPDPDNDGDGVLDIDDGAPNDPEDIDGFQDEDGVPDPDNDGDGVEDELDRCPSTPAGVEVDSEGCPVVEEIRGDLVLDGVTFASNSAELAPESLDVLRRVVESLNAWPEVRVQVLGHTDNLGDAERNRELSQDRARSVRRFLVNEGIDAARIDAGGLGEDRPIADNSTEEGRAANRRVELHRTDTGN